MYLRLMIEREKKKWALEFGTKLLEGDNNNVFGGRGFIEGIGVGRNKKSCLAIRLGIRIYIYFYYPREKLEKVFIFAKRDSLNKNPVSKTIWTNEDG